MIKKIDRSFSQPSLHRMDTSSSRQNKQESTNLKTILGIALLALGSYAAWNKFVSANPSPSEIDPLRQPELKNALSQFNKDLHDTSEKTPYYLQIDMDLAYYGDFGHGDVNLCKHCDSGEGTRLRVLSESLNEDETLELVRSPKIQNFWDMNDKLNDVSHFVSDKSQVYSELQYSVAEQCPRVKYLERVVKIMCPQKSSTSNEIPLDSRTRISEAYQRFWGVHNSDTDRWNSVSDHCDISEALPSVVESVCSNPIPEKDAFSKFLASVSASSTQSTCTPGSSDCMTSVINDILSKQPFMEIITDQNKERLKEAADQFKINLVKNLQDVRNQWPLKV